MRTTDSEGAAVNELVLVDEPEPGVICLTLNRPERLNALTSALVQELRAALDEVAANPTVGAVILTGSGRGFCAGLDLGGYTEQTASTGSLRQKVSTQDELGGLVIAIKKLPVPVIAAVNGPAAGGGLALSLAADIRIAAPTASFTVSFVKVGLSGCDMGVSWLLPRVIGSGPAFEMLLTGRTVGAPEAHALRLVTDVVPDGVAPVDAALETGRTISSYSRWGIRWTKEVMWAQLEVDSIEAGLVLENRTQVLATFTGDMDEAMAAFAEKRPPVWSRGEDR